MAVANGPVFVGKATHNYGSVSGFSLEKYVEVARTFWFAINWLGVVTAVIASKRLVDTCGRRVTLRK